MYVLKIYNAHQIKYNADILARRDSVVSFRWLLLGFGTGDSHWIGDPADILTLVQSASCASVE